MRSPTGTEPTPAGDPRSAPREIALVGMANFLLRHAVLIAALSLATGVLAVGFSYWKRVYTAQSRFAPQSAGGEMARFAGLVAQFGLSMGEAATDESLDFYVELLHSPELLREVALSRYSVARSDAPGDTASGNLVELYGIAEEDPRKRLRIAVDALRGSTRVGANAKAGLVSVTTRAPWPELAVQVNRRILDLVNAFNLEKRRSRAEAERRFVERRLDEARRELRQAEAALERFQQRNRRYEDSPQLVFEAARLQREISLRQQVYATLAQSYEQARIDEVRNTPVITIVDSPEGSERPDPESPLPFALTGIVAGAAAAVGILLLRMQLARERERHPESFEEMLASVRRLTPVAVFRAARRATPAEPR